jgi:hypothetical protein
MTGKWRNRPTRTCLLTKGDYRRHGMVCYSTYSGRGAVRSAIPAALPPESDRIQEDQMTQPLTDPPSPLIIAGEEFPNWRDVGRARGRRTLVEVTTDAGWGQALMGNLGGYIPGLLEDGTAVEWYVSTVNYAGVNEYKALLIPEVRAKEEYL